MFCFERFWIASIANEAGSGVKSPAPVKTLKSRLDSLAAWADVCRKTVTALFVFAVASLCLWAVVVEVQRTQFVIEPLGLASKLQQAGYSGEVGAHRLFSAIAAISQDAVSLKQRHSFVARSDRFDIVMPDSGISVQTVARFVKRLFWTEDPRLVGEVVCAEEDCKKLKLRVRILDKSVQFFSEDIDNPNDIDLVFARIAMKIVEKVDPYLAAVYLRDRDPFRARWIAEKMSMAGGPNQAWGFLFLGTYEEEIHYDLVAAAGYYDKALFYDPTLSLAAFRKINVELKPQRDPRPDNHLKNVLDQIKKLRLWKGDAWLAERAQALWRQAKIRETNYWEKRECRPDDERLTHLRAADRHYKKAFLVSTNVAELHADYARFLLDNTDCLYKGAPKYIGSVSGMIVEEAFEFATKAVGQRLPVAADLYEVCRSLLYALRAEVAQAKSRFDACLSQFDDYDRLAHDDATYQYNKARLLLLYTDRYDEALEAAEKAAERSPSRSYLLAWMAFDALQLHIGREKREKREASLERNGCKALQALTASQAKYEKPAGSKKKDSDDEREQFAAHLMANNLKRLYPELSKPDTQEKCQMLMSVVSP
jgi:hypothetical protein